VATKSNLKKSGWKIVEPEPETAPTPETSEKPIVAGTSAGAVPRPSEQPDPAIQIFLDDLFSDLDVKNIEVTKC
jgi:hypothetical protein